MVLPSCFRQRKVVLHKDYLLPPVLLIALLTFASLHFVTTLLTHVVLLPLLHVCLRRFWPKLRFSNFYLAWSVSSFVILVTVFELEVVPFLEILVLENAIVVLLAGAAVVLASVVHSRSLAHVGQVTVPPVRLMSSDFLKSNYCCYIQSVISIRNRWLFVSCLLCTICALVYSSHLIMSTICHPVLVADWILLPDDCSDVYSDPL